MATCSRNEIKGNILKRVVTRIDFQDLFELPRDVLRDIAKICYENKVGYNKPKFLETSDFQFNDSSTSISYPYEYIRDLNSTLFFNEEGTFIVEVNQLFLKVTQVVNKNYKRYGETLILLDDILKILKDPSKTDIKIKRISIKKANQVFFDSIEKFENYFKNQMLIFNQFSHEVDWSKNGSQSTMVQNFDYKHCKVNFTKIYDNGLINGNKYYRLYFDIETYYNEEYNLENDTIACLEELNSKIFELFIWILNDNGIALLKSGERMGDIDG